MLYFGRFLAEIILSINLKVYFPAWPYGHYGILEKDTRTTQSIPVTFINRSEAEMALYNLKNIIFLVKNNNILRSVVSFYMV